MSRIEERTKRVRRYCARAKNIVALALNKGLATLTFMRGQNRAGSNRIEIVRAVFPDKLSKAGRSKPNA